MEPLRIGLSARLLYPDASRTFLPTKSVQYIEQSAANWVMSGEVLAFMIPEMSLTSPHYPKSLKIKHYVDALDGLVLQGGADMSPEGYGETTINPLWAGDEIRDAYEIELFHEFVTQGKPVFGICRGHQVINVALGGKLYQDIATQCQGMNSHRDEGKYENHFHDMRILPNTWLSRLYPDVDVRRINTIHHQAIKTIGEGLVPEAVSEPDGPDDAKTVKSKYMQARAAQPGWAAQPLKKRLDAIARFREHVVAETEKLARVLTTEVGKPISQSRNELKGVLPRIDFFLAETARTL